MKNNLYFIYDPDNFKKYDVGPSFLYYNIDKYLCIILKDEGTKTYSGYSAVDKEHPLFERHQECFDNVKVHHGINYVSHINPLFNKKEAKLWWIGFHCCGFWDKIPDKKHWFENEDLSSFGSQKYGQYKDINYVLNQVTILVKQLRKLNGNN